MLCHLNYSGFKVALVVADGKCDSIKNDIKIFDVGVLNSRLKRFFLSSWRIYKKIRKLEKTKIVHFHDPDFLFVAIVLRSLGYLVIYDVHEDVPRQILSKTWVPKFIRNIVSISFEWFENICASRLSAIIAATPKIEERFVDKVKLISTVRNYPILTEFSHTNKQRMPHTLCYVGGISRVRGIVPLIESLKYLPDCRLILAGAFDSIDFKNELELMPSWQQVNYIGVVDRKKIVDVLSTSSIGIVTLLPIVNYLDSLPIKMFEYMAAGLPVLASNFPLWVPLIEGDCVGCCVNPEDSLDIAQCILRMLSDKVSLSLMGEKAKKIAELNYSWDKEFLHLVDIYSKLGVKPSSKIS